MSQVAGPLVTAGKLKTRIARLLTTRSVGRAIGTLFGHRIRNHGLVFDTSDQAISPEVEAQLFFRFYESAEIRLARHLSGMSVVIDLGSSLGVVASHVLSQMPPQGHLICVEANPSLIETLRRTTQSHAHGQRIDIVLGAIHRGDEVVFLETKGLSTASQVTEVQRNNSIAVPSLTLASLLERFAIDEPFALVSDIEGSEAELLLEEPDALRTCNRMLIELHDTIHRGERVSVGQLYQELRRNGFELLEQHGPVFAFGR